MRPAEVARLVHVRAPQVSRTRRALARSVTIDDLRAHARGRWPRGVRDYVDGGADGEISIQRNREAYESYDFVPLTLRDVEHVDLSTDVLGRTAPLPFLLGPTGMTRIMHADGEFAAARAARRAGVAYTLSTMSTVSVEDLARAVDVELWFQLYVWRERAVSLGLLERAKDAGYRALVITVDCPVPGLRVRDRHNGFGLPPQLTPRTVAGMALRPAWSASMLRGRPLTFANFDDAVGDGTETVMQFVARQFDPSVTWADVEVFRSRWDGPLLLKGAFGPADATRAAELGVDGLVLSNHGGRQLDRAVTPVVALPAVRAAVGDGLRLFVDSGIRRGSDVAVALCRGADACLIGRAYLYGLGAAGEAGCSAALAILADELRRTMQLLGVRSVAELRERGEELLHAR